MNHFADRLADAVRSKRTPLCVGLDPRWESLPDAIRQRHAGGSLEEIASAYEEFCFRILDLLAPLVAVVKPQAAFFEACGPAGMTVLRNVLRRSREIGLLSILDGKRNDIASTATAYAEAGYTVWGADSLTVNPYLGRDAVEPFLQSARRCQGGVFVLVRTSNPGAGQFQDLLVSSASPSRPVFEHVAEAVRSWAAENLGRSGLGDVGAVVGATYPAELARLRQMMPAVWFLVPGFGAQGGGAGEVAAAFRSDGLGAIVNSSRAILFPCPPSDPSWEKRVVEATEQSIAALARVAPLQSS